MRSVILAVAVFATLSTANIVFPKVQPTCDYNSIAYQGCLSGQECLSDNTCISIDSIKRDSSPRDDGRCGSALGGATCDPNGAYGGCCSSHGYCGKTLDHCLKSNGCQSGCDSSSTAIPTATGPAESDGLNQSEPVLGQATSSSTATATGAFTTDGSCGASKGGTVCGDWRLGSCCSMYGFCGSSSAHCGEGCQSGPCDQAPVSATPSATPASANGNPGSFKVVGDSGVPAMHAGLMPNGRVFFLDKVENYTQLKLSDGYYAYSAEYDPSTNEAVPLAYKTNAFCAGGSFLANGTMVSIGGNGNLSWLDPTVTDGWRGLRYLTRSSTDDSLDSKIWNEPGNQLDTARWYASAQTMPDGTIFVASGSLNGLDPTVNANNNPTYEILNVNGISQGESIPMELLAKAQPYYMYPFIHLLNDGTLFVFASKSSEIFDVAKNQTVKSFDDLPGMYRTYPNTGGSVLLPLSSANDWDPEILICGGGAYQDTTSPTDPSCGRISPLQEDASWEMDSMPEGRGMVEGTVLPDGTILFVNGAGTGAQGFGLATDPTLEVLIYDPSADLGARWTTGASSTIPRLYHSVALLLLDGTLMIAGSNPVQMPVLEASSGNPYITEFRVEVYTPPYLSDPSLRPIDIKFSTTDLIADSSTFSITFTATENAQGVEVSLCHGGFVTHSLHMSHRMLFLDVDGWVDGETEQEVEVTMPPNRNVAPPGPYVVYVVVDGVPGIGEFVMVS